MTGEKLLDMMGELEEEDILRSETAEKRRPRALLWVAAAAAAVALGVGVFAAARFFKAPGGEISVHAPTEEPTDRPTVGPMETPEGTVAPITSPEPPFDFEPWSYLVHGEPVFGYAFATEEDFAEDYRRGGQESPRMRYLFSMQGGEFYFTPGRVPEGMELEFMIPAEDSVALVYKTDTEPVKRCSFEWYVAADAREYGERLEGMPGEYVKRGEIYLAASESGGYRGAFLIKDGRVFYSVFPTDWSEEELASFLDPRLVMLPDPDPALIDELRFSGIEECLEAIRQNGSEESVLAGLEGLYVLKDCELPVTYVLVTREKVVVRYNGWEPERAQVTQNRSGRPFLEVETVDPERRLTVDFDKNLELRGVVLQTEDDEFEDGSAWELADGVKVEFLPAG